MAWAAAIGAAGSHVDQGISYGLNKMSASTSWDRQKKLIKRGYKWNMQGLERAGLNPILAAGGGISAGGAGSAQMAHAVKGGGNAGLDALTAQNIAANTAKTLAEKNITEAGQPHADAMAAFFSTERGRELIRLGITKDKLPSTAAEAAIKGGYDLFKGAGRNPELDALIGGAAAVPGKVWRFLQKEKQKAR